MLPFKSCCIQLQLVLSPSLTKPAHGSQWGLPKIQSWPWSCLGSKCQAALLSTKLPMGPIVHTPCGPRTRNHWLPSGCPHPAPLDRGWPSLLVLSRCLRPCHCPHRHLPSLCEVKHCPLYLVFCPLPGSLWSQLLSQRFLLSPLKGHHRMSWSTTPTWQASPPCPPSFPAQGP